MTEHDKESLSRLFALLVIIGAMVLAVIPLAAALGVAVRVFRFCAGW
jgi:hypothetical protein